MRGKSEDDSARFFINVDETLVTHYNLGNLRGLLDPIAPLKVQEEAGGIRPILPHQGPEHPPAGPENPTTPPATPTPPMEQPQQPPMESRIRRKVMAEEMATAKPKQPTQDEALAFMQNVRGIAFLQCNPYTLDDKDRQKVTQTQEKQTTYLRAPKYWDPTTGLPIDEPYTNFANRGESGGNKKS
jgi:hypothetical protein